jgi:hypothetical protein
VQAGLGVGITVRPQRRALQGGFAMIMLILFLVGLVPVVFIGRRYPGNWWAVDLAYYPLGGVGVVMLSLATQQQATLTRLNYALAEAKESEAQANAKPILTQEKIDETTLNALNDVVKMASPGLRSVPCYEITVKPRTTPSGCELSIRVEETVEVDLNIRADGDRGVSSHIPEDGAKRCGIVRDLKGVMDTAIASAALSGIHSLTVAFPLQELDEAASACDQDKAAIELLRKQATERVKAIDVQLKDEAKVKDVSYWGVFRYDRWPYLILAALYLKFGKAVAAL